MSAENYYLHPVTPKKGRGNGVIVEMKVNEPMRSRFVPGVVWTFERRSDGEGFQTYLLRIQEDDSTNFTDGLRFRGGIVVFPHNYKETELADFAWKKNDHKIDIFGGEAVSFFCNDVVLSFSSVESFPLHVNEYAKKR